MDLIELKQYCTLAGIPEPTLILGGRPIWDPPLVGSEQTIAGLLINAIGKSASDAAVIALRDQLGAGSQEWSDIVAYRKSLVEADRGMEYQGRILGLVIDFLFNVCTVVDINGNDCLVVDTTEMNKIKALRDAIEAGLPY